MGFRSCSGGTPSSRHLAEAHPQVLIIAQPALILAAGTLVVTLAIVAAITAALGGSLIEIFAQPTVWLVEGSTFVVTALAVLTRPAEGQTGPAPRRPSAWREVAAQTGWAVAAAVLIGVLLAVTIHTPILALLASPQFLIPAGIAVLVAALEAWPNER